MREDLLSRYTTLGVGGKAVVSEAASPEDFLVFGNEAVILGGGSNVLIAEKNLPPFIINKTTGIDFFGEEAYVASGEKLSKLCLLAMSRGLGGLEWATGLPGSMGGAVRGNAGACGADMSSVVLSVDIMRNGKIVRIFKKDCGFSYRTSGFKSDDVILGVKIKLIPRPFFQIRNNAENAVNLRKSQPKGHSAGCIFKNPPGFSAGKILDEAGLKGKRIGGAVISGRHANFIVNEGNATSGDVYELILVAEQTLEKRLGFKPEREVRIIGEF